MPLDGINFFKRNDTMSEDLFDFQSEVLERSHEIPVLVDFWASWCSPCRMLTPILESLAEKHANAWKLVKVDIEKFPDLAGRYGIRSVPTVKLFIRDEVTDGFSGALAEYQIVSWLKKAIPSRYEKEIELAAEFVRQGKASMAASLLEGVLQKEPDNARALSLLLRLRLFSDPREAIRLSSLLEGDREYAGLAEAAVHIGRLLEMSAENLPDDPVRERFVTALALLREERLEQALTVFIEVIRENRYYADDSSRKACIAIFRFLGEDHEITLRHRKQFDRALY